MDEREKNINGNDGDEYDKVCYVCRRPESKAGKMITLPGGIDICRDCMQKAFDTVMNSGFDMSRLSGITRNSCGTPECPWECGRISPGREEAPVLETLGKRRRRTRPEAGFQRTEKKKGDSSKNAWNAGGCAGGDPDGGRSGRRGGGRSAVPGRLSLGKYGLWDPPSARSISTPSLGKNG